MVQGSNVLLKNVLSSKALYKVLLKKCQLLPKDAATFYKASVRKEFDQHRDELDQERINQIIERAVKDSDWIVNKYTKEAKK